MILGCALLCVGLGEFSDVSREALGFLIEVKCSSLSMEGILGLKVNLGRLRRQRRRNKIASDSIAHLPWSDVSIVGKFRVILIKLLLL